MKKGVILFHKNILKIYENRWVEKSINSMINQIDNDFTFYEVNYGSESYSVIPTNTKIKSKFWSENLVNYAEAMNYILDKAFNDGCDYVFNMNLDDFYPPNRISEQIKMIIEEDFDIISSDFCYIQETESFGAKQDLVIKFMNIQKNNIQNHLENNHNVIAHPSVCYNKRFWLDTENRYDISKTPEEDLDLWKRAIKKGYKFGIHDEVLLFYRIHENQVSKK
jgi:hypothetical protein